MGSIQYPAQARELSLLLAQSQMTLEQLAERAVLKPETLRKYFGGYQRVGQRTMISIREVVRREVERMERVAGKSHQGDELHEDAIVYAGKLLRLPPDKKKLAQDLIDQLHGQEDGRASSVVDQNRGRKLLAGYGNALVEDFRKVSKPTPAVPRQRGGAHPEAKTSTDPSSHQASS